MASLVVNCLLDSRVINWFPPSLSSPLNKVWNLMSPFLTRLCVPPCETTESPILLCAVWSSKMTHTLAFFFFLSFFFPQVTWKLVMMFSCLLHIAKLLSKVVELFVTVSSSIGESNLPIMDPSSNSSVTFTL